MNCTAGLRNGKNTGEIESEIGKMNDHHHEVLFQEGTNDGNVLKTEIECKLYTLLPPPLFLCLSLSLSLWLLSVLIVQYVSLRPTHSLRLFRDHISEHTQGREQDTGGLTDPRPLSSPLPPRHDYDGRLFLSVQRCSYQLCFQWMKQEKQGPTDLVVGIAEQ